MFEKQSYFIYFTAVDSDGTLVEDWGIFESQKSVKVYDSVTDMVKQIENAGHSKIVIKQLNKV